MNKIYRCPLCDSTAIEAMWNERTIREAGVITTVAEAREQPHHQPWFICPYCEESVEFAMMRSVQPRKVKREHFEEDEGLFEL